MKILITGSEGFVGKALSKVLSAEGHDITGFDIKNGDIADKSALREIENSGIEHVFHLAAKSFVPESWKAPFEFYQTNLIGTVNILEFCRKSGAGLTYISSYLYGAPEYLPIDENHPVKAYNPYSHSKIIAEDTCRFYRDNFDVPVTILRPFNIYGPGQDTKFLIPHIINQITDIKKESVEVMDLNPKRDFLYIDDFINALILTVKGQKDIYNIGSGTSVSVEEIIRTAFEVSSITKPVLSTGINRPNEIYELYADVSKAKELLKWEPSISLREGLKNLCSL